MEGIRLALEREAELHIHPTLRSYETALELKALVHQDREQEKRMALVQASEQERGKALVQVRVQAVPSQERIECVGQPSKESAAHTEPLKKKTKTKNKQTVKITGT